MKAPKVSNVLLVVFVIVVIGGIAEVPKLVKVTEFAYHPPLNTAEAVQNGLSERTFGRVLYYIPSTMIQGKEVDVPVRISASMVGDLKKGLKDANKATVENIDAYTLMGVRLQDDGGFAIVPPPEQDQFISRDRFSEWTYKVTPVDSGEHHLTLLVGIRVMLPGGHEESRFDPILERNVAVKVNVRYATMRFLGNHIDLFISAFIFGPAGFFLSRWIERRDKIKTKHKKK